MAKLNQLNKKRKGFGKPPKPAEIQGNVHAPETAPIDDKSSNKKIQKNTTKALEYVAQITVKCKPETHKWMKLQALNEDIRMHELFEKMKEQYQLRKK